MLHFRGGGEMLGSQAGELSLQGPLGFIGVRAWGFGFRVPSLSSEV